MLTTRSLVAVIAAAFTLFLLLVTAALGQGDVLLTLVVSAVAAVLTMAPVAGRPLGPHWLPAAGAVLAWLTADQAGVESNLLATLLLLGYLAWVVAEVAPYLGRLKGLLSSSSPHSAAPWATQPGAPGPETVPPGAGAYPGTPSPAPQAAPGTGQGLFYRRRPTAGYRRLVLGAALCFLSLLFEWQDPSSRVSLDWVRTGSVTVYTDSYGYEVYRDDNTWLSPQANVSYAAGRSGFESMGAGWALMLLTFVTAGYVGLNRQLSRWLTTILPAVGVGLVALTGLTSLISFGIGLGTLLNLAGSALVTYAGFRLYAPILMPRRFGHLHRQG